MNYNLLAEGTVDPAPYGTGRKGPCLTSVRLTRHHIMRRLRMPTPFSAGGRCGPGDGSRPCRLDIASSALPADGRLFPRIVPTGTPTALTVLHGGMQVEVTISSGWSLQRRAASRLRQLCA